METVNIHDAKTRLFRLLEGVRRGEPFVIAKAGRPIAKVISIESTASAHERRLGFLVGEIEVPDDFDRMGSDEIAEVFGVEE
jgi:prevent-host-death family protein